MIAYQHGHEAVHLCVNRAGAGTPQVKKGENFVEIHSIGRSEQYTAYAKKKILDIVLTEKKKEGYVELKVKETTEAKYPNEVGYNKLAFEGTMYFVPSKDFVSTYRYYEGLKLGDSEKEPIFRVKEDRTSNKWRYDVKNAVLDFLDKVKKNGLMSKETEIHRLEMNTTISFAEQNTPSGNDYIHILDYPPSSKAYGIIPVSRFVWYVPCSSVNCTFRSLLENGTFYVHYEPKINYINPKVLIAKPSEIGDALQGAFYFEDPTFQLFGTLRMESTPNFLVERIKNGFDANWVKFLGYGNDINIANIVKSSLVDYYEVLATAEQRKKFMPIMKTHESVFDFDRAVIVKRGPINVVDYRYYKDRFYRLRIIGNGMLAVNDGSEWWKFIPQTHDIAVFSNIFTYLKGNYYRVFVIPKPTSADRRALMFLFSEEETSAFLEMVKSPDPALVLERFRQDKENEKSKENEEPEEEQEVSM